MSTWRTWSSAVLWFSEHRALCLRALCSVSQSTVFCVSEHRALCLRAPCSVSQSTVFFVSEHRALCLRAPCSGSQSTVLWFSEHRALVLRAPCSGSLSTVLMFKLRYSLHVSGREVKNSLFHSDTLIYGISRDGSKNYNIRTCEHMTRGQLRM